MVIRASRQDLVVFTTIIAIGRLGPYGRVLLLFCWMKMMTKKKMMKMNLLQAEVEVVVECIRITSNGNHDSHRPIDPYYCHHHPRITVDNKSLRIIDPCCPPWGLPRPIDHCGVVVECCHPPVRRPRPPDIIMDLDSNLPNGPLF